MIVKVLREAGYEESLLGLSLSFYDHKISLLDFDLVEKYTVEDVRGLQDEDIFFWTNEKFAKAQKIALHLAHKKGNDEIRNNDDYIRAEKKFLRSICVWVYIQASRAFWSEYDTYTVGLTKQSSSTMHTLDKRDVTFDDFEEGTSSLSINAFNLALTRYKDQNDEVYKDITRLKMNLPEGWLQERVICTNYATLGNIINQREGHRLKHWKINNDELLKQLQYPELLVKPS